MACCATLFFCTDTGPVQFDWDAGEGAYVDGDGNHAPPAGWDGNPPYLTKAEANAACPFPPPGEGELTSCCPGEATGSVWFSLTGGYGSKEGVWDGTYWSWSGDPGCGATVYLRYTTTCVLQYSCDGATWLTATRSGGTITCGPFNDPGSYNTDWKNIAAGCLPGNPCFGAFTVSGVTL